MESPVGTLPTSTDAIGFGIGREKFHFENLFVKPWLGIRFRNRSLLVRN